MKVRLSFDRAFLIVSAAFCMAICLSAACSMPTLETASCTAARSSVREFYSIHFANDLELNPENLQKRERFLSPDLVEKLRRMPEGTDPFTVGEPPFPRAFRVGSCREIAAERVEFDVLVFWRDEASTEQRKINAEVIDLEGRWLVDQVSY